MIQYRNKLGQLRIRNVYAGREVVFTPADGSKPNRRVFNDKQEAVEFFEQAKRDMEDAVNNRN